MPHKLRDIRQSLGLTIKDLAELSGISEGTITRIESGENTYKVNDGTAKALADAMYLHMLDIFTGSELSHLGRPPLTGKPIITINLRDERLCPDCRLTLPVTGVCGWCCDERLNLTV